MLFRSAFRRRGDILKRWPDSGLTRHDLVNNAKDLCAAYQSAGRWVELRDTAAEARTSARLLVKENPNKLVTQMNCLIVLQYAAEAFGHFGQPTALTEALDEQARPLELLIAQERDASARHNIAETLYQRSVLLSRHGQPDRAKADRTRGLGVVQKALDELPKESPQRANFESLKAQLTAAPE